MAGFSYQCRPSGRKQWALRGDAGRTSLHGLRSQMAEDGCPDSQVVMAKKLLDGQSGDEEESSRQGVYWLIKASEQGNEEATLILQQCLEKGRGITELNFLDVKACLSMSQEEKLARRAARKMFSRLSAGEDFITSEQLLREMRRVREAFRHLGEQRCLSLHCPLSVTSVSGDTVSGNFGKKLVNGNYSDTHPKQNGVNHDSEDQLELPSDDDDLLSNKCEDWSSRSDTPGEKLSEEHLVSAAVMYAQGELPLVQRMLDLQRTSEPTPLVFLNPLSALVRAYSAVIEALGCRDPPLRLPSLSTAIQIILALILYSLLESVDWPTVIPIAIYHGSFMLMIVFTCQILYRRHEFHHFRVWSGLFLRYSGGSLNPDEAEYQYCRNNLKPYAHFFIALIFNLMMYPLLAPHWTPHSELTVVSLCLTLLSLYYFLNSSRPFEPPPPSGFSLPQKQFDPLVLFSFAVNVLAKYPYDLDSVVTQGWRFVDVRIPTFASYVVGHGIEFCLNFRGVFYLLMPAVLLKIAARDRWRGTYRVLIPHCVTLAWWQIAVLTAQGSTWYGLIRATLAVVGMVLFLPLAGLASVLLPLAAATRFVMSDPPLEALQVIAATLLASTPLLVVCWLGGRHSPPGSLQARLAKMAVRTQLIAAVGAGVLLILPLFSNFFSGSELGHEHSLSDSGVMSGNIGESRKATLSWDHYHSMCYEPSWQQSNIAHAQRLCSLLDGVQVKWEGVVRSVRISKIKNPWMSFIKRLPESLGSVIACAVSSRLEDESQEDRCSTAFYPDVVDQQRCKFVRQHFSHVERCSLSNWDSYEFEVEVKMSNGLWASPSMNVFLHAEDNFRNFTFALHTGDHIWFSGPLSNFASTKDSVLGGTHPFIHLNEAGCIKCKLDPPFVKSSPKKLMLHSLIGYVYIGAKFILNCLLNPVVTFK